MLIKDFRYILKNIKKRLKFFLFSQKKNLYNSIIFFSPYDEFKLSFNI